MLIVIDLVLAARSAPARRRSPATGVAEHRRPYLAIAGAGSASPTPSMPTVRQTLIKDIVEERALDHQRHARRQRHGVQSSAHASARAIAGEAWCLPVRPRRPGASSLNALSYGAIIAALLAHAAALRRAPAPPAAGTASVPQGCTRQPRRASHVLPGRALPAADRRRRRPVRDPLRAAIIDASDRHVASLRRPVLHRRQVLMSAAGLGARRLVRLIRRWAAALAAARSAHGVGGAISGGVWRAGAPCSAWSRTHAPVVHAAARAAVAAPSADRRQRHQRPAAAVGARCPARPRDRTSTACRVCRHGAPAQVPPRWRASLADRIGARPRR